LYNEIIAPDNKIRMDEWGSSDDESFMRSHIPSFTLTQSDPDFEIQKTENDSDKIDIDRLEEAAAIGIGLIRGLDLQTYGRVMDELPTVDLDIKDLNSDVNDHDIQKGALNGFSLFRAYSKLLPGGAFSELNYVFTGGGGKEYVIRQIPHIAASTFDLDGYTKKETTGAVWKDYYIRSDGYETTLRVGADGMFQTTISGNISETEAETVFSRIKKD
jgi:hypothetical protein